MGMIKVETPNNLVNSGMSQLFDSPGLDGLGCVLSQYFSPRQTQILLLMMQGTSRSEIASTLNLSARTIDTVRARMMLKLNAKSNTDLVLKAFALCIKNESASGTSAASMSLTAS